MISRAALLEENNTDNECERDSYRNEQYLSNSENKAWKKKIQSCTEFEPMTYTIPVQYSTNGNKSNRPRVISPDVKSPGTCVMLPEIKSLVVRRNKYFKD